MELVSKYIEESSKRRANAYINEISKFNKLYTFPWPTTLHLCVSMDTRKCYVTGQFLSKCSQRFIELADVITPKGEIKNNRPNLMYFQHGVVSY